MIDAPEILLRRAGRRLIETYFKKLHPKSGENIVDQVWDNLLILDGCRLDLYRTEEQDVDSIRSLGSTTTEFLRRNFSEGDYYDIVYVTANPFVDLKLDGKFHETYSVWETHWSDEHGTVLPESVTKVAKKAHENHPNKRLIVHYMQPHYPFIDSPDLGGSIEGLRRRALNDNKDSDNVTPWLKLRWGETSEDVVWEAYKSNFETVKDSAEDLVETLGGRSVITSDHGNAMGEWIWPFPLRYYGHNRGVHIPALVNVPWDFRNGSPRKVRSDPPVNRKSFEDRNVEEKLTELGYLEG